MICLRIVVKNNVIETIQIIYERNDERNNIKERRNLKVIVKDEDYNNSKTYNYTQLVKFTDGYHLKHVHTKKGRPKYIPILDTIYKFIENGLNINKITNSYSNMNYHYIIELLNVLYLGDEGIDDIDDIDDYEQIKPVLTYTKDKLTICCPDSELCSICFEQSDSKKYRLPCNHMFHVGCIDPWISRMNTCPVCRAEISVPMTEEYAMNIIKRNLIKWVYKRRNTITHTISIKVYTSREKKRRYNYSYADTDKSLRRSKGLRKRQKKYHKRISHKTNCQRRTLRY